MAGATGPQQNATSVPAAAMAHIVMMGRSFLVPLLAISTISVHMADSGFRFLPGFLDFLIWPRCRLLFGTHLTAIMFVLQLLAVLTLAYMNGPKWINPLFKQIFTAQSAVLTVLKFAELTVCPGLLDVLINTSPPSISFFESLPDAKVKT